MARVVALALVLAAVANAPGAAADGGVCVGDGALGACVSVPGVDDVAVVNLPVYCLHAGGVEPCPPPDA